MGRNTKWTEELKNEMMQFFKNAENTGNKSVVEISEEFAKKYDNLTASQVKTAYYKFYETANTASNTPNKNRWSQKENDMLMKEVKNKKGTLTDVFENFAKAHNRTPQNVSQHYYFLMRQENKNTVSKQNNPNKSNVTNQWSKKTKAEEVEKLSKSIKRLPIETIESLHHIVSAMQRKA